MRAVCRSRKTARGNDSGTANVRKPAPFPNPPIHIVTVVVPRATGLCIGGGLSVPVAETPQNNFRAVPT